MLRRCSRVEKATKGSRFIEHHSKSKKARCPAQPWRAEANARTSTYTYADIRRPMQMRPDPADSSRSVHATPLRSMNARPQRRALGARPAPQNRSATMRACPCARWFQSLTTATQAHAARRLFSRYPHAADQLGLRFTQPAPGRPDRARGRLSFRPRAIH